VMKRVTLNLIAVIAAAFTFHYGMQWAHQRDQSDQRALMQCVDSVEDGGGDLECELCYELLFIDPYQHQRP